MLTFLALACADPSGLDSEEPRTFTFESGLDSEPAESGPPDSEPPDSEPPDSEPPPVEDCEGLGTYEGSPTLNTWEQLVDFGAKYDRVEGSVYLSELEGVRILSPLKCLRSVSDHLTLRHNEELVTLGLEQLEDASWLTIEDNPALESIELPLLETVTDLSLEDNDLVTRIDLPALRIIEGKGELRWHDSLSELSMPGLSTVGDELEIRDHGTLQTVDLSSLEDSGELSLYGLPWTDLSQLSALERAEGLTIDDFAHLSSLEGLSAELGWLNLRGLPALTSLESFEVGGIETTLGLYELGASSLEGLEGVAGGEDMGVYVGFNEALTDLSGLQMEQLSKLTLYDNASLASLEGLGVGTAKAVELRDLPELEGLGPIAAWTELRSLEVERTGLERVEGLGVASASTMTFAENASLVELDLSGLEELESNLYVRDNDALASFSAPDLASVKGLWFSEGELELVDLSGLQSVGNELSLPSLDTVSGGLRVLVAPDIASISAPSLQSVGDSMVLKPEGLTSLSMPALTEVGGSLTIGLAEGLTSMDLGSLQTVGTSVGIGALGLEDLSGLAGLVEVSNNLELSGLDALVDLEGLDSLETVGGELSVDDCAGLVSLEGMESLSEVGELRLTDNEALASLDGLEALTETGDVVLYRLDALEDLSGLSKLEATTGLFTLNDCDAITHVDGLSSLVEVGSSLNLLESDLLEDLEGLHGVQSVGGSLKIKNNAALPDAEAEALRDAIGTSNIGGTVTISGNGG